MDQPEVAAAAAPDGARDLAREALAELAVTRSFEPSPRFIAACLEGRGIGRLDYLLVACALLLSGAALWITVVGEVSPPRRPAWWFALLIGAACLASAWIHCRSIAAYRRLLAERLDTSGLAQHLAGGPPEVFRLFEDVPFPLRLFVRPPQDVARAVRLMAQHLDWLLEPRRRYSSWRWAIPLLTLGGLVALCGLWFTVSAAPAQAAQHPLLRFLHDNYRLLLLCSFVIQLPGFSAALHSGVGPPFFAAYLRRTLALD